MKPAHENAIVFADPRKCLGCHSCEVACALAHGDAELHAAALSGRPLFPRVRVIAAAGVAVPVQCRQCEDAPCALACPNGAILQEQGTVRVHEAHCMGCKLCAMVCPFGAIAIRADAPPAAPTRTNRAVARKCDLCAGRPGGPACVEACPTRATKLVDLDVYRRGLMEARAAELAASQTRTAQPRE